MVLIIIVIIISSSVIKILSSVITVIPSSSIIIIGSSSVIGKTIGTKTVVAVDPIGTVAIETSIFMMFLSMATSHTKDLRQWYLVLWQAASK